MKRLAVWLASAALLVGGGAFAYAGSTGQTEVITGVATGVVTLPYTATVPIPDPVTVTVTAPATTTVPPVTTTPAPGTTPAGCKVVATDGASLQADLNNASAGDVICAQGTIQGVPNSSYTNGLILLNRPGVTLTSAPGQRATLHAFVRQQSNNTTVSNVNVVASGCVWHVGDCGGIWVAGGTGNSVLNDDLTNGHSAGICILVGGVSSNGGSAANTLIEGNRIHACGVLPRTNQQHGIYVDIATGTLISNNVIFDNADWGIQLYPSSNGTRVTHNLIAAYSGEGGAIIFGSVSPNNTVDGNVLSSSGGQVLWTYQLSGGGDVVTSNNCILGTPGGGSGLTIQPGFTTGTPLAVGVYSLPASNPCSAFIPALSF